MSSHDRFKLAIERFDAVHASDPAGEELLYAQRMTAWLQRLAPDAPEPLRLAARAQHLARWEIPRDSFPRDRRGYLTWRTKLYDHQADRARDILTAVGYADDVVAHVHSLIRKEGIKQSDESQLLEDVACLVFLEHYFADFAREHDDEKLIKILRKTWNKMSPRGHAAAMKLNLGQRERELISRALEQ
jgi:hypothetical protein